MILISLKEYYKNFILSQNRQTEKLSLTLNIFGYYQIVGGIIGLGLLAGLIMSISSFNWLLLIILFVAVVLFFFSIYCGIILLKRIEFGLKVSKINQLLQVIHFSILGYGFQYASGLHFSIGVDLTTEFNFTFNIGVSSWQMNINNDTPTIAISLNFVALLLIIFIDKALNRLKENHLKNSVLEIGQKTVDEN